MFDQVKQAPAPELLEEIGLRFRGVGRKPVAAGLHRRQKLQVGLSCASMGLASPVYLEIVDFIAAGTTPEAVMNFQPSQEAQHRLAVLIEREKAGSVSPEEKAELDHFIELEHILRMAKARARHILSRCK